MHYCHRRHRWYFIIIIIRKDNINIVVKYGKIVGNTFDDSVLSLKNANQRRCAICW